MPTEAQVRQWARDEHAQIKREEQAACEHRVSGTLRDGVVTCNHCGESPLIPENLMRG